MQSQTLWAEAAEHQQEISVLQFSQDQPLSPSLQPPGFVFNAHFPLERIIWHGRRSLGFCSKMHLTKAPRKSGRLWSGPCFKETTLGTAPGISEVFRILLSKTLWVCSLLPCSEFLLKDKSELKTQCFSYSKTLLQKMSPSDFLLQKEI